MTGLVQNLPYETPFNHRCVWCGERTARRRLLVPVLNLDYPFDRRTGDYADKPVDVVFNRDVWVCDQCIFHLIRLRTDWNEVMPKTNRIRFSTLLEREAIRHIRPIKEE